MTASATAIWTDALSAAAHHGPAIAMTANDHLDYFGQPGVPAGTLHAMRHASPRRH